MYADLQFPKSSNSGDMKRDIERDLKRGEQRNMRARIEAERDRYSTVQVYTLYTVQITGSVQVRG